MTARILVVDDIPTNVKLLEARLSAEYFDVLCADNGARALAICQTEQVDIVLLDIMMPDMDGYQTTRAIRALPRFRNLPIIALTAKAMKGDREKCIESGASDYIPKPVVLEELVALLRVWLPQVNTQPTAEAAGANERQ